MNISLGDGETAFIPVPLSIAIEKSNMISVPPDVLKSIKLRVEILLISEDAILPASGNTNDTAFIVESQTSLKPHFVKILKI